MASVLTLVTVKRAGVYHPPGTTFLDFDLAEAEELGPKRVTILSREEPEPAPTLPPPALPLSGGEAHGDGVPPETVPPAPVSGGTSRVAEVLAAFDLLDESDWTDKGRPKAKPLSDVLGWKAATEEIDAALKLREEAL